MPLRSSTSDEATACQVDGYPSYYLAAREGRFVPVYTPRPAEGDKTVAAIEQALARWPRSPIVARVGALVRISAMFATSPP